MASARCCVEVALRLLSRRGDSAGFTPLRIKLQDALALDSLASRSDSMTDDNCRSGLGWGVDNDDDDDGSSSSDSSGDSSGV